MQNVEESFVNLGNILEASYAFMMPLSKLGLKYRLRYELGRSARVSSTAAAYWMGKIYTS